MNAAARRDYLLLTGLTAVISVGALIFYYHQGAILLYGDAVAHINIARRVFDSRTPGLVQLGTVWLPLPHILDIPFIVNDRLWQTGLGGSIVSMLAYIAGALGVFRLVRLLASRAAAWIAALAYALNPNLIYMQSTAMTESLYLAFFIWSVVYFAEFVSAAPEDANRARRSLEKCALMVSGAMLVRYDGWFLAAVIAVAALIVLLRLRASVNPTSGAVTAGPMRHGLINFVLLTGATAGLFLAYNHAAYGNALEFANGPYSPRAIQERSKTPTMPTYPGEKSPRGATLQFLKISRLNLARGPHRISTLHGGVHRPAGGNILCAQLSFLGRSCGYPFRFTFCVLPGAACPSINRSGGPSVITTCATGCNCCRRSRSSLPWAVTLWASFFPGAL